MLCEFEEINPGEYRCKRCKSRVITKNIDKIKVECSSVAASVKEVITYAKAVTNHILSGADTRSDEEVEKLLDVCKKCDFFTHDPDRCLVCGCHCNKNNSAYLNKLRMKSQHCPKEKW